MQIRSGKYKYTLRHVKTGEEISAEGISKKDICARLGLKEHQYQVASQESICRTVTTKKNLTNAELINILSQRNPDDEVDILVDYSSYYRYNTYNFEPEDGLSYVVEDNQLVVSAGDFD